VFHSSVALTVVRLPAADDEAVMPFCRPMAATRLALWPVGACTSVERVVTLFIDRCPGAGAVAEEAESAQGFWLVVVAKTRPILSTWVSLTGGISAFR